MRRNTCLPADRMPVARPRLPGADAILPLLREIDANGWYANHGPLARRLQARLAAHWGLAEDEVALLASATAGLTLALRASGAAPGSRCLLPSWTFAASAGAVVAAGLVPHFVDVNPASWTPEPATIRQLAQAPDVGAALIVSPFGAPLDLAAWEAVQAETGKTVLIDAAAAFDTLRDGGEMRAGGCTLVVSLHATKVFGIGEGGALLSRDPALMQRVRALCQFGFAGTREALVPGGNAKLSEHTAAVGLAALDAWPAARDGWARATRLYADLLPSCVTLPPQFGRSWVSSTLNLLWPDPACALADSLAAEGIASLRWWGSGCHAQPAYRACASEALPVTERLAARSIGLPFWPDLSPREVERVCGALRRLAPRRATARARRVAVPA